MKKQDKMKIVVSSNIPTEAALKNFQHQLYKMSLKVDNEKPAFPSNDSNNAGKIS